MTGGKLVTITFADDTTVNLFVTSKQIYSGVTWTATNSSGEATEYSAKDAGNASTIIVRDAEGNVIIRAVKTVRPGRILTNIRELIRVTSVK